jgi:hypothetical protein
MSELPPKRVERALAPALFDDPPAHAADVGLGGAVTADVNSGVDRGQEALRT